MATAPLAELIARYAQGETLSDIGRAFDVSPNAIKKRLVRAGVAIRGLKETNTKHGRYANGGRPSRAKSPSERAITRPKGRHRVMRIMTTPQGIEESRRTVATFITAEIAQGEALNRNETDTDDAIFVVVRSAQCGHGEGETD